MNTKELLLEKFIYVFNNCEVIFEYIELSISNYIEKPFKYPQLEELLFSYKGLSFDNNYQRIEAFKRKSDVVSSYDIVHRIYLTDSLLTKLFEYIKKQKKDVKNRQDKLKIMSDYFCLLAYINQEEKVNNSYINITEKTYCPKLYIYIKKQPLSFPKYKLISKNNTYFCQILVSEEENMWVKDNPFIKRNVDILITEEDQQRVLKAIRKEREHIKKFEITK